MPTMITGERLRRAVEESSFIQGGNLACVEGVKYDFRMSNFILKAKYGRPIDAKSLTPGDLAGLIVEPGEVVFVLTEETLNLPSDMIAQLSQKRKLSQSGLLTLGGLTIDPGYSGRLMVGLYNFSSTPFPLRPGKKLVAATFFRLNKNEQGDFEHVSDSLEDFPDELIEVMQKYQPVGSNVLSDRLEQLKEEVNLIRRELKKREEWEERLSRHDKQIENLLRGLEAEKEARCKGEDRFTESIEKLNRTFLIVRGGAIAIWAILALILVPLLLNWLPKMWDKVFP